MQSPKFVHKATHLKKIVSATVLSNLWKDGVRDRMRKQIVPDAVEFLDFHLQLKQRCNELEALVCAGDYIPKPILRLKVEKSRGLCRQIALPSPEEAIILQALSNSLWSEIAPKAPSSSAFFAPQDQPFAKQNPIGEDDEWGYGPIEAWLDFQREILKFSQSREYVVVTDIANYYDFILHSFLRAILADYGLEKEHALDLLLFILDSMLWRPDYMPNFGIGLPQMDLDAPRLLAHTHLFEIDQLFVNLTDVDFARYMDDMDFGVDSEAKAKTVLRDLDLALQTRNLRLNSGKTKILTAKEAYRHFKISENASIDKLITRIKERFYLERWQRIYRRLVIRAITSGMSMGTFNDGNGDKILKRLLGLATRLEASLPAPTFRSILYGRPGLRQILLQCWARSPRMVDQISTVSGFLLSGESIDDLSKILIATSLSGSLITATIPYSKIFLLLYGLKGQEPFTVYARLWLVSRIETPSRLWSEIQKTQSTWSRNRFLSRLVAGFYGLFRQHPFFNEYETLVRRWGGPDAISVLELHERVMTTKEGYGAVRPFLNATNPSVSTGISHSKALLLASALQNSTVPKLDRAKLLGVHSLAMADTYYGPRFSAVISATP